MRRTKIVATVGPACDTPEVLDELIRAGMDVARINLSHGSVDVHRVRIRAIREAARRCGKAIGIMLDTRGAEVRIGALEAPVMLRAGDTFELWREPRIGGQTGVSVTWDGLFAVTQVGQRLLFDDGNMVMECTAVADDRMTLTVINGGQLQSRKKINCPGSDWPLDPLPDDDVRALEMGIDEQVDFVAASFVRTANDVLRVRRVFEQAGSDVFIIAKIEHPQAVEHLEDILSVSDGVMVARGDLGVEMPSEDVPWLQKHIIQEANRRGLPVITATQMLESMVYSPRPTRAEASDVANAIWDGSDAVMLSAETATGKNPVEAVRVMAKVAENADARPRYLHRVEWESRRISDAVSQASAHIGETLGARAILTVTESGYTARMVSRSRPVVPIVAISPHEAVVRRLSLVWGVESLQMPVAEHTDDMIAKAIQVVKDAGVVKPGDIVVVTAGVPHGTPGTTNLLRVETVAQPVLTGQGLGVGQVVTGVVHLIGPAHSQTPPEAPYVAVTYSMEREYLPVLEGASAIIAEEAGLTSAIAVAGISLGIPTVVGVAGARASLQPGETVTVDPLRGLIYRGRAQV